MNVLRLAAAATLVAVLVAPVRVFAQPVQGRPEAAVPSAGSAKAGREADLLPAEPVVAQKTGTFNGQTVSYTVEAGWIPIRDEGKVVAKMFYVGYTKNGVTDLSKRPLIISFNGGPGTASVWMHMGFTGPRRVTYDDDGFQQKPPAGIEDNPQSILDVADIVYLDPIGTGFSRMMEGEDLHKFHGKVADIQSVGDFILTYVNKKDRWTSPKFIIGESYGTTRASGLAVV